jgi:tetratricopeptide (TPR) repeat protein
MQLERYSEAESSFRLAYNFQPFNHRYLYLVGVNQLSETTDDRLDDAVRTFGEVYEKNYRAEEYLEVYTDALILSGQVEQSFIVAEECYRINPANIECLQDYTDLSVQIGEEDAIEQILSDLSVTFEQEPEISGFFTVKIGYLTGSEDTDVMESILLNLEESDSRFAQEVRVYTYFYLSRIYEDSNRDKYINYLIRTVDLDSEGRFPEAQEELSRIDIPDRTQDFWWWVDELI